jgi:hypothetical protein
LESWGYNTTDEYKLEDGSLLLYVKNACVPVSTGTLTSYEDIEFEWRNKVIELVNSLSFKTPVAVEFNLVSSNIKRFIPTVILTGKETWLKNGSIELKDELQPVIFRSIANIVSIPKCITDPKYLDYCYNNPNEYIITPYCVITKNFEGFGNTVFLRSVVFSTKDTFGAKSIYDALKEEIFWTKILVPLATIDFETLRSEFKNQEIPLAIQLRMFKIQSQEELKKEIDALINSKIEAQESIPYFIKSITDNKIKIKNLETTIREKTTTLEKGLLDGSIEDEFKRIISLPYIDGVKFTTSAIVITTKPIQIDDGPILGGYSITYNLKDKQLHVANDVNPNTYYDLAHPHIYQNGTI